MAKEFTCERDGFVMRGDTDVGVEGDVAAGEPVETAARHIARIPVAEITSVDASDRDDLAGIERLVARDALPGDWRRYFAKQLESSTPTTNRPRTGERSRNAHAR